MTVLRLFPVPKYIEMPMAGIDISQFNVTLMALKKAPDHLEVDFFDTHDLKIPLNLAEDISKHTELISLLKEWKKKYKLEFIEVSIPEERAYLFETKVLKGTEQEIRATVEFNLEENVPISPSESVFDFRLLGDASDTEYMVAVTVLPTEIVQTYIHLFELADLTVVSFLIEAQALSKAVIKSSDKGAYFIVHIDALKTGLFISAQDSVQFTSTIQVGSNSFTDSIAKGLNIDAEKACEIKMTKGFTKTKENAEVISALSGAASVFKDEIEKVYVYWHTRKGANPKLHIQKIILCGDDALMPGLADFIAQALKIEVVIGNVWENVASFDTYIPPIPFEQSLKYGSAIGLALPHHRSK